MKRPGQSGHRKPGRPKGSAYGNDKGGPPRTGAISLRARDLQKTFDELETAGKINRMELIDRLLKTVRMDDQGDVRLIHEADRAAEVLLDRWFGMAPRAVEITDTGQNELPESEKRERVIRRLELAEKHEVREPIN